MPVAPAVPARLRNRFFRGSAVVRAGLVTRDQLRSTAWRQLFRDVYVDAAAEDTHAVRACAAATVLVPGAVVSGGSAGVLWGVPLASVSDDVELTVPPGERRVRVRGIRVRRRTLPEDWLWQRRGVRTLSALATALDVAGSLQGDDAIVAVDQLLATGIVDLGPLRSFAAARGGPGSARARAVCGLADERAESPQETRLRLLFLRSGLPAPVPQYVVRDSDRHIARVDFAWPEHKVAVEYDGLWHAEAAQFARDRRRLNRLHAAGWRVVFVTAADLHEPAEILARVRALLG